MEECEEQAAALGTAPADDKEIPPELKMRWRDEINGTAVMEHEKPELENKTESDSETGQLAEGFVQTVPAGSSSTPSVPTTAAPASRGDASGPAISNRQPAGASPRRQPAAGTQHRPVRADNGVPQWLDQLIAILLIVLVAVVLHRVVSN